MDVLKKPAESRMNARLSPDTEKEEGADGDGDISRDERAVACLKLSIHEEKPVRIIFLSTPAAEPGQARQLPWVIRGNATPNNTWLAVFKHYILHDLDEDTCEDDEHPRQFIGIPHDIQSLNVTPDTTNQIELINDN